MDKLRKQLLEATNKTSELELEFEAAQKELDELQFAQEAPESPKSKKQKVDSDKNTDLIEKREKRAPTQSGPSMPPKHLDTVKLAETVLRILKTNDIALGIFAQEVVGVDENRVNNMLKHPLPWVNCTEHKKSLWQKMHQWSQSIEPTHSLEADQATSSTNKESKSRSEANSYLLKLKKTDMNKTANKSGSSSHFKPLDTFKLAETIRSILKTNEITLKTFASQVTGLLDNKLTVMFNQTRPWDDYTEYKKGVWYKMHEWSQSPEAIQSLKKPRPKTEREIFVANFNKLPEVPPNLKLNTAEVAQTVKEILDKKCISVKLFGKEVVSLHRNETGKLLAKPPHWNECSDYKKKLYFRIHQWSQSADEIQSLEDLNKSECPQKNVLYLSNFNKLPDVPSNFQLDTAKTARTIKDILQREHISYDLFARHICCNHPNHLFMLLTNPKPWSECTEYRKKVYYRMHVWSESSLEIISLKSKKA